MKMCVDWSFELPAEKQDQDVRQYLMFLELRCKQEPGLLGHKTLNLAHAFSDPTQESPAL